MNLAAAVKGELLQLELHLVVLLAVHRLLRQHLHLEIALLVHLLRLLGRHCPCRRLPIVLEAKCYSWILAIAAHQLQQNPADH